jgi:hypothetical protein
LTAILDKLRKGCRVKTWVSNWGLGEMNAGMVAETTLKPGFPPPAACSAGQSGFLQATVIKLMGSKSRGGRSPRTGGTARRRREIVSDEPFFMPSCFDAAAFALLLSG